MEIKGCSIYRQNVVIPTRKEPTVVSVTAMAMIPASQIVQAYEQALPATASARARTVCWFEFRVRVRACGIACKNKWRRPQVVLLESESMIGSKMKYIRKGRRD
jgi:hypothetical protein